MEPTEADNKQRSHPIHWSVWVFAVVITVTVLAGIWFTFFVGRLIDADKRNELKRLTSVAAAGINANRILSFTGTLSDKNNPDWLAIRARLDAILKTDTVFRWAYLMYVKDTAIYFYMDMPDVSGENAQPGELYNDAPKELFVVFRENKSVVVGPYTDRWGTFISAFHPVIHPASGKIVAVLGLDIEASHWHATIYRQQLAPVLVTFLLVMMQTIAYLYIRKRRHYLQQLESAYKELEQRIQERTKDLMTSNFELELHIKEREKMEEMLRQKSEELDRFFTVNLDLLSIADADGYLLRLNTEWEHVLGYPLKELEGKKFIDFVHPEDVEDTIRKFNDLHANKTVINFVNRYRCCDGSYRWIEWRSYPAGDKIYSAARDITSHIETLNALRQSEQKYRLLAEETNDWIWEINKEVHFIYSNPKATELTGYSLDEIIGHSPLEWMLPEDALYFQNLFMNNPQTVSLPPIVEVRMLTKSRQLLYLEVSSRLIRDEQGFMIGIRGIARDMTDKKRAESELRQIKEQLEYILGVTRTGIDIVDLGYNLRYVDPFWEKRYGDFTGKKCYTYFRGRSEPCLECTLAEIFIHKKPLIIEAVLEHEDNRVVQVHSIPFQNHDGEWLVAEFNVDITEHKRIEKALRDSETRYRAIMEQATEGIFLFDVSSRIILESNRSYQTLLGYTADELSALTIYDVVAHERQSIDLYIDRVIQQQRLYIGARKHRHKLGYEVDVEASAYCIELGNQQVLCVVVRDIRDRLKAERTLQNLVRRQALILQSLPLVFYTASPKGDMPTVWISEQVEKITGYKPEHFTSHAQFWSQRLHPSEREWIVEKYKSIPHQKNMTLEYRWLCADGQYHWFIDQTMLVEGGRNEEDEIVGVWLDITERKRNEEEKQSLEAQLQHAQKLESLGVMAGGIAHDFNNLLTAILGYADLGAQKVKTDMVVREYLDEIQKSALRASDLTRQLLAYAGKGKYIVQKISLPQVIEEMASIIQVSLSKKVILNYQFDPDTPLIEADQAQIRQVILNLIINASEAIGSQEGVITIRTGQQWCESKFFKTTWLADDLPEGNYVYLEISDTGCGMDEQTLSKIFDPFFTTKFSGRGLGLAAVLGIVRGHKAALQVFSALGKGTSFRIFFPAVEGENQAVKTTENVSAKPVSGNILLVDDEEPILKLGQEILEMYGFQVEVAHDGMEALNRFQQNPARYHCILLDLTMPRMDGQETLAAMRRIRPDIKVVLTSGYSETEIGPMFVSDPVAGFIQKPYNVSDLIRIVSDVIQKNLYS